MTLRSIVIFAVVLVLAVVASMHVSVLWADAFLIGRTFTSQVLWWSPVHLVDLLDEVALILVAGTILGIATGPTRPFWLGLALGATFCAIRLAFSFNWFGPDATVSTYVWAYSPYYVPMLFGGLGVMLGNALRRRSRNALPNKSFERTREG
jgi:hypothetical protein